MHVQDGYPRLQDDPGTKNLQSTELKEMRPLFTKWEGLQ